METISQKGWDPDWKNALVFERENGQFTDATTSTGLVGRFFHVRARNLNPYKQASNCYCYVRSIENLGTHEVLSLSGRSVELKWAGYVYPNVLILPSSYRLIDGLVILHNDPNHARFNTFTDSTEFIVSIPGPGDYVIKYVVYSENFQSIEGDFFLHLGDSIDETIFEMLD
jgi:hypothetical protein